MAFTHKTLITLVAATTMLVAAPQSFAAAPHDWSISSSGTADELVRSGARMRLVNKTNGRAVVYGERTFGINLVWADPSGGRKITFVGRRAGAVRYGDRIAIRVDRGGYLRHHERHWGINLGWSAEREYQWEIRGGPTGEFVRWDATVGLWNTRARRYVVYGRRSFGINLVWHDGAPPRPRAADLEHTYRIGPFPSPGTAPCTGTIAWTFEPVRLTGTTGRATRLSFTRTYSVFPRLSGFGEYFCEVHAITGDLRVGRWRVRMAVPTWLAICETDLHTGRNLVSFRANVAGCKIGF